ncbi:hypothetical protein ACI5KX_08405 [Erythrobacter sp. GH1-10]|uniref:hypothetical protein n=1 Tax=Erythrobacter sp. GH1-10 TaxID=3349334 RepID=UPI003877A4B4
MKNALGLAACVSLGLAACSGETAAPDGEAAGDTTDASEIVSVNLMQPGLYAVGDGTQVYSRTRLSEDGTYVDLDDAGEKVGNGTWEQRGELMCFDPEGDGEEAQERCWTNGEVDEDGSFTTTREDGSESYTVTPLEE